MKACVIFLCLNFGAFAAVEDFCKVGDSAELTVTLTDASGNTVNMDVVGTITQVNAGNDTCLEHAVVTLPDGSTEVNDEWVSTSKLVERKISDADLRTKCTGGTIESVTVTAGTFLTCKMDASNSNSKGFNWIGAVPFAGVVKSESLDNDGNTTTIELTGFSFAP